MSCSTGTMQAVAEAFQANREALEANREAVMWQALLQVLLMAAMAQPPVGILACAAHLALAPRAFPE